MDSHDPFRSFNDKAYRFITFEGLKKTIEEQMLRFARIDSFNDPLDFNPFLANKNWELVSQMGYKALRKWQTESVNKRFNSMYVCCFSKKYDDFNSYLMWSHYADSHKGVCFEFDFSILPYLGNPSEVNYPEDLCLERQLGNGKNPEDFGIYVATTKLANWKYEEEVRLIVDTKHPLMNTRNNKHSENEKYLHIEFNPINLTKIIFGLNSNIAEEEDMIKFVTDKNMKLKFEKMIVDPRDLKLKPLPYFDYGSNQMPNL